MADLSVDNLSAFFLAEGEQSGDDVMTRLDKPSGPARRSANQEF